MTIGFVGFGEAASSIALGLYGEGLDSFRCYDALQDDPRCKEKFDAARAACKGTKAVSAADACRGADVVMVAVPSNFAMAAARSALDGVGEGQLFMDVTTAGPAEKIKIAEMIEAKGALFVDGAMLGALLKDQHKVSMLLSGSGAQKMKERMEPYHMRMEVVGEKPGAATGIKFIRSITAKGISCLLIESLQAAQKFGVEQSIVDSFLDSYGPDFLNIINNYVSGAIIHSERRMHEMENVVNFLKNENLPFTMAEASRDKLAWLSNTKVKDHFENGVPRSWSGVLEGWKL